MSISAPANGLSSNWKALQKSLKRKSPTDDQPTAKNPHTLNRDPKASKRPRIELVGGKSKRMNGSASSSASQTKEPGRKLVLRTTASLKSKQSDNQPPPQTTTQPSRQATIAWAKDNDLDPEMVAAEYDATTTLEKTQDLPNFNQGGSKSVEAGRYVAIDCEMVGVGGPLNERSALARVSLVNFNGHCILDIFVRPKERVTDWRTWVSGVSPKDMVNAVELEVAQQKVHELINGRILVGHAVHHDLEALFLSHPKRDLRDTSRHIPFKALAKQRTPGLRKLAKEILGVDIQSGAHSSVEDARVTMLLYRKHKAEFEQSNAERFSRKPQPQRPRPKGSGKKKKKKSETDKDSSANGTPDIDNNERHQEVLDEVDDLDEWLA